MVFSICKCKFMVFGFHHYARSLINDNYILDLFKNAPVNYSPTFGQLNIGGPIVAYIMQKHSDYYGGAVIVFGYNNLRPIYYHIGNDTIDAEYYL